MKRVLVFIAVFAGIYSSYAQNPFEQFGDKSRILTMTNGRFNEFHDQDSIVQIGSILLDVNKKIIVGYVDSDTIKKMPDPTTISRWWAVDPLAEKYYNMSPYNFVKNNPILFVDPNGDSVALNEVNNGGISGFQSIVNQGSGGFYQADVDQNTGIVSMTSTGQDGKMTDGQQKFVNELTKITTAAGVATINVSNNSQKVVIGNIASHTIDVGDMQNMGTDGMVTAQKTLVHEVSENYNVQVKGQGTQQAHIGGTNAENRIGGGVILNSQERFTTPSSSMPDISTLRIPVIAPANQNGVSIMLYKNNIIFISGNNVMKIQ